MKRDAIYSAERGIYWTVGAIPVLCAAVLLVASIREALLGYARARNKNS